jgi:hypothetical protein
VGVVKHNLLPLSIQSDIVQEISGLYENLRISPDRRARQRSAVRNLQIHSPLCAEPKIRDWHNESEPSTVETVIIRTIGCRRHQFSILFAHACTFVATTNRSGRGDQSTAIRYRLFEIFLRSVAARNCQVLLDSWWMLVILFGKPKGCCLVCYSPFIRNG